MKQNPGTGIDLPTEELFQGKYVSVPALGYIADRNYRGTVSTQTLEMIRRWWTVFDKFHLEKELAKLPYAGGSQWKAV